MTNENLIQVVYESVQTPGADPLVSAEFIATSKAEGRKRDLSGLLLSVGGVFIGILEGVEAAVLARMEIIAGDESHAGLRVLRESSISTRRFSDWTFNAVGSVDICTNTTQMGRRFATDLVRKLQLLDD